MLQFNHCRSPIPHNSFLKTRFKPNPKKFKLAANHCTAKCTFCGKCRHTSKRLNVRLSQQPCPTIEQERKKIFKFHFDSDDGSEILQSLRSPAHFYNFSSYLCKGSQIMSGIWVWKYFWGHLGEGLLPNLLVRWGLGYGI